MRIAACIILYHPNREDLEKDILAIAGHIDELILWRNSPEAVQIPDNLPCPISWMGSGENKFISYPLNSILSYCSEQGFDYLLTMDQDSQFEDFGAFIDQVHEHLLAESIDTTIIFAPNINHRYPDSVLDVIPIESTITSGSLCDVRKSISIGGFRESYQINWVDDEFCHRARLSGYRILAFPRYNLKQQFGKKQKVLGVDCFNYSAPVYYHVFRNMFWMHREYKTNPSIKCIL